MAKMNPTKNEWVLLEILQMEHNLTALSSLNGQVQAISVPPQQLKAMTSSFGSSGHDAPEASTFLREYSSLQQTFYSDMKLVDSACDEFCTKYLEALQKFAPQSPQIEGDEYEEEAEPPPVIPPTLASDLQALEAKLAAKKKRGTLPKSSISLLRQWLFDHMLHPYPTEEEKAELCRVTSLSLNQLNNWFINARRRILQPMIEKMKKGEERVDEIIKGEPNS